MEPVLPLEVVPFDETVEITGDVSQMSAEEYLSWVRTQSSRLPTVFRATHIASEPHPTPQQTKYMPTVASIASCPESYLPSREWERDTLYTFSQLRLTIDAKSKEVGDVERTVAVPPMKDRNGWLAFCLDIDSTDSASQAAVANISIQSSDLVDKDPLIRKRKRELARNLGIAMELEEGEEIEEEDPELVTATLKANYGDGSGEEIEEEEEVEEEDLAPTANQWQGGRGMKPTLPLLFQFDQVLTQKILLLLIDHMESTDSLSSALSEWIYALLARVEKPLHRDVVASLRQLFRRACQLRSNLSPSATDFTTQLAALNLLIAITGNYFGQNDSASEFFVEAVDDAVDEDMSDDGMVDVGDGDSMEEGEEEEEEEGSARKYRRDY